ncbi:MAG: bifunctional [glutamate--ammonia ligase]-adenylyl-L-tyrosine phosphorylase/[glutamate--ammonia-ligase] adenylyltransferase, partial [Pseudomonadota bacterium]|nr:bifunctional [glutamate--ammonia ligase]-adenylyl-L-tyrosine phosphorylase/[glutamate--ammonia-ligase] adenylyltransferase [Pseudomonadota bacterium]
MPVTPDFSSIPEPLREPPVQAWQRMLANAKPELPAALAANDGDWLESVPRVWGASNFVAGACARQPEMLGELLTSGDLLRSRDAGELAAVVGRTADAGDEETLGCELRRIRRREMVRIAWRDLAGWAEVEETLSDVSALAEACIDSALARLHQWQVARHGEPVGARNDEQIGLVVLGLGKLGGGELNYSSDIDLVFAYPEEGETRGERPISNHQFFLRLGQALIRTLDQVTAEGFVFRTDMRLRPNGDSGPLAISFAAMEHYYQTHGRDWERYALIKAQVVGGNRQAGRALLQELRPFVYRKYLDYGAFESIRSMKEMIERELLRKGMERNIKLGRGGIREIEFLAQSYQLIRGGRELSLQTQRLYAALEALRELGVLEADAVAELIDAYRFLRNTEHRLQMVDDRQTQLLPTDEVEQLRLAWSMGYSDWKTYSAALNAHRDAVHRQF